jgi:oligopeptide transport system permease protein
MTDSQGNLQFSLVTYPTGVTESSADNLHSALYAPGSLKNAVESGNPVITQHFVDDYTALSTHKDGLSKMGFSFVIGIISVIMSYLLAIPLGTLMALKKDKLFDKLGTLYIVFVIAVPSLAYIFLFKAIGGSFGLPTMFDVVTPSWQMYILPIISLALPSVAGLIAAGEAVKTILGKEKDK